MSTMYTSPGAGTNYYSPGPNPITTNQFQPLSFPNGGSVPGYGSAPAAGGNMSAYRTDLGGWNPYQYGTDATAQNFAKQYGGQVVQTQNTSAPYAIPQQNLFDLGSGDPMNAGLTQQWVDLYGADRAQQMVQGVRTEGSNFAKQYGITPMQPGANPSLAGYDPAKGTNPSYTWNPMSPTGGRPPASSGDTFGGVGGTQQQNPYAPPPNLSGGGSGNPYGGSAGLPGAGGGANPYGAGSNPWASFMQQLYGGQQGQQGPPVPPTPTTAGGPANPVYPGNGQPPFQNWTPPWQGMGGGTPVGGGSGFGSNGQSAGAQFQADQTNDLGYLRGIAENAGYATDATPAWQAMVAAQQRNIAQKGADLNEQFNVSGNRFSSAYGNAMGDYYNQASLNQNAQLTQAQMAAQEAARGRELSAAGALGGFGSQAASQLSGQDFGNSQLQQQQALQAALAGFGGSSGAAQSLAGYGAQGAQALLSGSQQAGQALYGNENNAALQMFGAQNQMLPAFMQYDQNQQQMGNSAASQLSNLWQQNLMTGNQIGQNQFSNDTSNINRAYQEWLRTQPAYSPYLPYLFSSATAQPTMYNPQYQPSAFSQIANGVGGLLGGLGAIGVSDKRLKENIENTGRGIETLRKIRVVDYNLKGFQEPQQREQGFIAQELHEVYPDPVIKPATDEEFWRVNYARLTPLLVQSVQDLARQVDAMKLEIRILKKRAE